MEGNWNLSVEELTARLVVLKQAKIMAEEVDLFLRKRRGVPVMYSGDLGPTRSAADALTEMINRITVILEGRE